VVYPPITPFLARVSMTLFGASMIGLRINCCNCDSSAERRPENPVFFINVNLRDQDLKSDLVQNCEDVFLLCWIDAPPIHGPRGIAFCQG
jgi:hypothetical protein